MFMMRLARKLKEQEEGFALVTGVFILLILTTISITVVQLSAHNANQSAYDRNRLQAVNAAEAGIDDYLAAMPTAIGAATCTSLDKDLPTTPSSHYHVLISIYSAWPPTDATLLSCPPSVQPKAALVISAGTAVANGAAPTSTRTMETEVRLNPFYGALNMAIFSDTGINLVNRLTDDGYASNDADIYTNGDYVMNNNSTISGSLYAQGNITITIGNQATVKQDVWANGWDNISGNATILGRVRASTSSITNASPAHIYGAARAGTTITNSGTIDGTVIPNSPAGPPPKLTFPQITYNPTDWTSQGYTLQVFSTCATAQTFINALPTGNYVIRITPQCALSWGNNSTVTQKGNLAIITDGSVTFQNQINWSGSGGTYNLFFIRPYQSGLSCAGGANDINFSNNTNWSNVILGVYTQCTANIANQNGQFGQIFGGTVNINNQMTFNYSPILFPGGAQAGYSVQISYLREIVNG